MPNLVERLATFGAAPRRVRLMPSISNASVPEVPTIGQVKRYVLQQTAFGGRRRRHTSKKPRNRDRNIHHHARGWQVAVQLPIIAYVQI